MQKAVQKWFPEVLPAKHANYANGSGFSSRRAQRERRVVETEIFDDRKMERIAKAGRREVGAANGRNCLRCPAPEKFFASNGD